MFHEQKVLYWQKKLRDAYPRDFFDRNRRGTLTDYILMNGKKVYLQENKRNRKAKGTKKTSVEFSHISPGLNQDDSGAPETDHMSFN
jgi:hypothetical protein